MKKNDIILIITLLIVSVAAYMVIQIFVKKSGDMVVVTVDGKEYASLSINEDTELDIVGINNGINKLIIENDCTPISNEHLEHIFEAFYRVEFDRNKSSGGNGLGLYIVQQILKMYNLDYSFKSILTGMSFEVDFN